MRFSVVAATSVALLLGCKKEQSVVNAPPPVAEQKPAPVVEESPDAGGPLTLDEVDRWIAYKRDYTAIHRRYVPEIQKVEAKGRDGGTIALEMIKLMDKEGKETEAARTSHGLNRPRIVHIEALVQELVTEREMAEDTADPKEIAEMEALAKKSSAEQKAALEKSIADLKKQRERSMALTDMRSEFGNADVDVLLQREKEVRAAWTDWMAALAGEAK